MSLTLGEMKEKLLKLYDPDDLLEALEITSIHLRPSRVMVDSVRLWMVTK